MLDSLHAEVGVTRMQPVFDPYLQSAFPELAEVQLIEFSKSLDTIQVCNRYAENTAAVEYAHPDYLYQTHWVPNDYFYHSKESWGQNYADLWALKADKLDLEKAWDLTRGEGATVAVIDSGVDDSHPDIAANLLPNSNHDIWDFTTCAEYDAEAHCIRSKDADDRPEDVFGHGTYVSGIIAAVANNEVGIVGIAPEAKIMPLRTYNDVGQAVTSELAQALYYAIAKKVDVINNSWGCGFCPTNPTIRKAVETADQADIVVVFSAGNESSNTKFGHLRDIPNHEIITVASSTREDKLSWFSSRGVHVDVTAPGGETPEELIYDDCYDLRLPICQIDILSLQSSLTLEKSPFSVADHVDDRYMRSSGTSSSAAYVSGLAALLRSYQPDLNSEEIRQAIRASSEILRDPRFNDTQVGAGRINASAALTGVETRPPLMAYLTSPKFGEIVTTGPELTVTGTVWGRQQNFESYQIYKASKNRPIIWSPVGKEGRQGVYRGDLTTVPLDHFSIDRYYLRLKAKDKDGREYFDTTEFTVDTSGRKPKRITSRTATLFGVDLNAGRVVWSDGNIHVHDLSTGNSKTLGAGAWPSLSDNQIIWVRGSALIAYDLNSGQERTVLPRFSGTPKLSGNLAIWIESRNGKEQIVLKDISTNTPPLQLTTYPSDHRLPAIDGNRIIWEDSRNDYADIFTCTYISGSEGDQPSCQETPVVEATGYQRFPDISGNRIAWENWDDGTGENNVRYCDFIPGKQACSAVRSIPANTSVYTFPKVHDEHIVYQVVEEADIYSYNVTSGQQVLLDVDSYNHEEPLVFGDDVIWQYERQVAPFHFVSDLYHSKIPE